MTDRRLSFYSNEEALDHDTKALTLAVIADLESYGVSKDEAVASLKRIVDQI